MTSDTPTTIHGRLVASTSGVASCSIVGAIVGAVSGMPTFLNMASGYEALFHARQSLEPKFALDLTEVDEPEPSGELPTDDNADEEIGMVSCSIEWNQDNSEQKICYCAV